MKRLSPEEQREARREFEKSRRDSPAARQIRKKKAIESFLTRYLKLECGHYGERQAIFKPRGDTYWCDVEGIFSPIKPKPITSEGIPEKVPF